MRPTLTHLALHVPDAAVREALIAAAAVLLVAGPALAGPVTLKANPVDVDGRVTGIPALEQCAGCHAEPIGASAAEAELLLADPGTEAVGYRLDVCLRESSALLRCARGPG